MHNVHCSHSNSRDYAHSIHYFYSYSNGTSTTGLSKHLLHEHGIEVKTQKEEAKQKKLTDIFISTNGNKTSFNHSTEHKKDERFILGRRMALWLCKDLLPFKLVENKGFRDLWSSLSFGVSLPSRQIVSVSALDDMYACMKNELIARLKNSSGTYNYNIVGHDL